MTTAVLLDVVASRQHEDQIGLLRAVAEAADRFLGQQGDAKSAGPTIGDEVQALYDDLRPAIHDVARLRLALRVDHGIEVRAGFGVGEVIATGDGEATAPAQSGSAWWHARTALEEASSRPRAWPARGWWAVGDVEDPDLDVVRALLVALDTVMVRFDDDDRHHALRLLDGAQQVDLVAEAGVSQSTMSERLHRHGVYGWVRTLETLTATDR